MAIDYEVRDDGIATLTFNSPERMNALGPQDLRDIDTAFRDMRLNDKVLVGIITGAGQRAMSAGMDTRTIGSPEMRAVVEGFAEFPDGLRLQLTPFLKGIDIWKPLIAAINGHAIALTACLILGTDLRIASTNATFGLNEVLNGEIAAGGALARLPRQIPYTFAMDLLLTGRRIDAQEMLRYGLVLEVVEPDRLMPRALELAAHIATKTDRHAVSATKQAVVRGLDVGQSQAMVEEALYMEMVENRHGEAMHDTLKRSLQRGKQA